MAFLGSRALGSLNRTFFSRSYCSGTSEPTVGSVLKSLIAKFEECGIPEPELSAKYLISHVFCKDRAGYCDDNLETRLDIKQKEQLDSLVLCREARMPIQYILRNWDFHAIRLDLRPPVFIPRPETEQLVDLVLERLGQGPQHVLEIGPGSGAISLALLNARHDLTVTAVERSVAAVELTKHNAELLGLEDRIEVLHSRVETVQLSGSYDAVVSNPPYVLRKDLTKLQPEIYAYEDLRALDGGSEGLDVILPILKLAAKFLHGKESAFVALEVDPCHPYMLPPKLEKFYISETIKDFNKNDRFLVLHIVQ